MSDPHPHKPETPPPGLPGMALRRGNIAYKSKAKQSKAYRVGPPGPGFPESGRLPPTQSCIAVGRLLPRWRDLSDLSRHMSINVQSAPAQAGNTPTGRARDGPKARKDSIGKQKQSKAKHIGQVPRAGISGKWAARSHGKLYRRRPVLASLERSERSEQTHVGQRPVRTRTSRKHLPRACPGWP